VGRAGEAFAPLEAEPSLPDLSRGGRASANEPPGGGRASAGDDFGAALDSSPGLIGDLWGIAQVGADEQPGGSAVAGEGARPLLAEGAAHAPARDGLLAVEDAQEEARPADLASVRPVSPPGPPQNLASASPGDGGVAGAVVGTPPGRGGAAPCEVPREGRPGMDALDFLTNISLDSPPGLHARASPASGVHGSPDDWLVLKRGGGHGKEYVRPPPPRLCGAGTPSREAPCAALKDAACPIGTKGGLRATCPVRDLCAVWQARPPPGIWARAGAGRRHAGGARLARAAGPGRPARAATGQRADAVRPRVLPPARGGVRVLPAAARAHGPQHRRLDQCVPLDGRASRGTRARASAPPLRTLRRPIWRCSRALDARLPCSRFPPCRPSRFLPCRPSHHALDSRRVAPPTMQREALRLQAPAAEAAPARRRTRAHATRS